MKRISMLIFIGMMALGGCQSSGEISSPTPIISPTATPSFTSTPSPREDELMRENVTLKAELGKLQDTIEEYKNDAVQVDKNDPLHILNEKYPQLAVFNSIQKWQSISIISGGNQDKVEIADPELLETVGNMFKIKQESQDIINGPKFDIDPFTLKLTNNEGTTYLMEVVQRNVATFPEIAPGAYFDISFSSVTSFGKAFMKKPSYVPVESTESRMLNSGMIYVKEGTGDKNHYYMREERSRLIFIQFYEAAKKKIKKPAAIPANLQDDITFFLYGTKIEMKVYPNHIEVTDGSQRTWYEVDKSIAGNIHGAISAN